MSLEMTLLTWTLVLALVQVILPGMWRTREAGVAYNAGPRDQAGPPMGLVTGRLFRAQRNLFETLPVFIGAVLIAEVTGATGALTACGAWLFLLGRLIYLPLYALGVPWLRSGAWMIAFFGLLLVFLAILV